MTRWNRVLVFVAVLIFQSVTYAAHIEKVKGSKALLNLEGEAYAPGAELTTQGKNPSKLVIKQVRGDKAIVEVTEGTPAVGDKVMPSVPAGAATESTTPAEPPPPAAPPQTAPPPTEPAAAAVAEPPPPEPTPAVEEPAPPPPPAVKKAIKRKAVKRKTKSESRGRTEQSWGFLLGYNMDTMSMTVSLNGVSENINMTGTSVGVSAFYDHDFGSDWTLRIAGGYQPFNTSGTLTNSLCSSGTSTSCKAQFSYLEGAGSFHYNILKGEDRFWVGGGATFLFSISRSLTVPNLETTGSTNQMLTFGTGYDFGLRNGSFIPISIEYGLFPGSSSVKASAYLVRIGYGLPW